MVPWSIHAQPHRVGKRRPPRSDAGVPTATTFQADPELEQELLQAMKEFETGEYIELTVEQLEHCAATGASPWPDASRG